MRTSMRSILLCATIISAACNRTQTLDQSKEEQAIRQVNQAWLMACIAKDAKRMIDFYDDDALLVDVDGQIYRGKEMLLNRWTEIFLTPGYSAEWQIQEISFSKAGDIAITIGPWTVKWLTENGEQQSQSGTVLIVWKKQANGNWKPHIDK